MRLFEFATPVEEADLDEAAAENNAAYGILRQLLKAGGDINSKDFKREHLNQLIELFPNLTAERLKKALGLSRNRYHSEVAGGADHSQDHDPNAAGPSLKDVLKYNSKGELKPERDPSLNRAARASKGYAAGADNGLEASDYVTKNMINDAQNLVNRENDNGSAEWEFAEEAGQAVEVTWYIELFSGDSPEVKADQDAEANHCKKSLDGLYKRYKDRAVKYEPNYSTKTAQGGYVGGILKLSL